MAYSVDNALFHWEEGERRLSEAPPAERLDVDRSVGLVLDDLRRRLGSSFTVEELAGLYATDLDWAEDLARGQGMRERAAWVVDAAFSRYAREAVDFAGGRRRVRSWQS